MTTPDEKLKKLERELKVLLKQKNKRKRYVKRYQQSEKGRNSMNLACRRYYRKKKIEKKAIVTIQKFVKRKLLSSK